MAFIPLVSGTNASAADVTNNIKWAAYEAHCAKAAVRVATTANGTLASAFENGDTVDGVTLATGDRILLKNQTDATQNGIYTVNASGAPTRAVDMDTDSKVANGAIILVKEGSSNAGKAFFLSNSGSVVIGSTSLTFAQFGGAGGSTPTGTGFRHVTSGTEDAATKLVENADVSATAAIAESKIAFTDDAAAGTASRRTLGTGAQQAAAGNHSHSAATTSVAGFMSAADKLKLDNSTAAATASTLALRDSNARLKVATPSAGTDAANKDYVDGVMAAGASDADEVTKGISFLSVAPDTDPIAVGDNDPRVQPHGFAGVDHSGGLVHDPGSTVHSPPYVYRDDTGWAALTLDVVSDVTATASEVNILDGATLSTTELNYVDGVTSSIQTQLNAKAATGSVGSSGLTMSTSKLLGRSTASTGAIEEITVGTGLSLSGGSLTATGTGVTDGDKGDITVSSSGTAWAIDSDAVTYAKMQNVSAASKLLGRGDSGSGDPQEITLGTGLTMTGTTLSASGGGNSYSGVQVYRNVSQTITSGVATNILWNAELWDTDNYHDLITDTDQITVPADDKYRITGHISFTPSATVAIKTVSGTILANYSTYTVGSAGNAVIAFDADLTAADPIVVQVTQTSGSDKSVGGGLPYITFLSVTPVGGPQGPTGPGGSITVTDGTTTVNDVTTLNFDGGTVTDDMGGSATVTVTGGGGGDTTTNPFLKTGTPSLNADGINTDTVFCYLFKEGSGATLGDLSSNAYNGTITNATWSTSQPKGYESNAVLDFDGTGDYVTLPSAIQVSQSAPFTFAAHFRPDSFLNTYPIIATLKSNDTTPWQFAYSATGFYQGLFFGNANSMLARRFNTSFYDQMLGSWLRVVITHDGSNNYTAYLNGVPQTLDTNTGYGVLTNASFIGGASPGTSANFDGRINIMRLWSRELSWEEAEAWCDNVYFGLTP